MKNIKSYALIAALALGLSACGGNKAPADKGSATGSASTTSTTSTESAGSATEATDAKEVKTGTAEADGYDGKIKVTVTMEGDKITKIDRESSDSDNVGEVAMDELTDKIIKENSTDVEATSGATVSSEAFIKAVKEAVQNAK
ncbi:MAG: FMN-binding protein [Peptoniphilaceae bacterium]|nr:FMN-binding protein [Peptoniphilaceae bacterium]MDY6018339.1 FMN-binding protein [Anaerococcus sp.]